MGERTAYPKRGRLEEKDRKRRERKMKGNIGNGHLLHRVNEKVENAVKFSTSITEVC